MGLLKCHHAFVNPDRDIALYWEHVCVEGQKEESLAICKPWDQETVLKTLL